ncbi:MAG: hypothetical protein JWM73_2541 [Solirubrobacterales bacterium]|nr:hypothetical protein [Solirubrobacterales bacterium]
MAAEAAAPLPEVADVYWRPRVTPERLRRRERVWTLYTLAHVVPFLATGALLMALQPLAAPLAAICLVHAWIIPALYAQRGANVLLAKPGRRDEAERVAAGLLGDLVSHDNRELHAATGCVTERGALGAWVVGPAGAVLIREGGRRADCWCVRVADPGLPSGDRTAHLLLALRADEAGFATVANLAFSGAVWRVRRRTKTPARGALDAAAESMR